MLGLSLSCAQCLPTINCPDPIPTCHKYALRFTAVMRDVSAYVARLASLFGADWFRFDYFYGHPQRSTHARNGPLHPSGYSAKRLS